MSTYLLRMLWGLNEIKQSILPLITRLMPINYYYLPNYVSLYLKTNSYFRCALSIITLLAIPLPISVVEIGTRGLEDGSVASLSALFPQAMFAGLHLTHPFSVPWCPLSYLACKDSPLSFQGGNPRSTFLQALQVKFVPVQSNSILPSESVYPRANMANHFFPLLLPPFLVSRISVMHLIYFGFTVCIWAQEFYNLSCKYTFTFSSLYSKPQAKITFIT